MGNRLTLSVSFPFRGGGGSLQTVRRRVTSTLGHDTLKTTAKQFPFVSRCFCRSMHLFWLEVMYTPPLLYDIHLPCAPPYFAAEVSVSGVCWDALKVPQGKGAKTTPEAKLMQHAVPKGPEAVSPLLKATFSTLNIETKPLRASQLSGPWTQRLRLRFPSRREQSLAMFLSGGGGTWVWPPPRSPPR